MDWRVDMRANIAPQLVDLLPESANLPVRRTGVAFLGALEEALAKGEGIRVYGLRAIYE